jgi:hypothetical protein
VQLFHGSPRSHIEDILASMPPEVLDAMLAGTTAAVLTGGHTHIQMLRQHHGRLLINPGSVGLAFKDYVSEAWRAGRPTALSIRIRDRFGREAIGYASVALGIPRSVPDEFRELTEKDL